MSTLPERIRQRRAQMLVHSYLYYVLDQPIITDDTWQKWADELEFLQTLHGAPIGFYDKLFSDWDGTTGCHLPQRDPWVIDKAAQVTRLHLGRR